MAKVTIEFDLSEDDDLREYNLFNNANSMFCALFDISHNLKKNILWEVENKDHTDMEIIDLIFGRIAEILEDNNVLLEKLE